jgi:hypothetical protein
MAPKQAPKAAVSMSEALGAQIQVPLQDPANFLQDLMLEGGQQNRVAGVNRTGNTPYGSAFEVC